MPPPLRATLQSHSPDTRSDRTIPLRSRLRQSDDSIEEYRALQDQARELQRLLARRGEFQERGNGTEERDGRPRGDFRERSDMREGLAPRTIYR